MTQQQSSVSEPERLARAALCRLFEPGRDDVGRYVAEQGPVAAWQAVRAGCAPSRLLAAAASRLSEAAPERDMALLERVGGRLVCPGDPQWPSRLADLGAVAPLALWVRGQRDLAALCERSVAVVGSRAATAYGDHVAGTLAAALADLGVTVVSGGAYGIDGAAHRGALAAAGATIAVVACGVDVSYPKGHDSLFRRLAVDGLIVSEWPPGCAPMRHRFLVRNRVIAAATAGTVVVEAALRSGALSTARVALRLGRPVMAVPGPITSAMSAGCHALLRVEGARCVSAAAEVVEEVGRIGELAPDQRPEPTVRDRLGEQVRRVLDAVPVRNGASPARIAAVAGVDPTLVLRCLGPLELEGLIERSDAGYRLTAAARAS